MKKEEIIPGDWERILFGQAPPIFLVEVLIRTFIIYLFLVVIVRLMGKRMGGQLTISELAVMVTLGAIVSPGMQMPQTGLLLGIMVLVCALIFQRGLTLGEFKSATFEDISQGTFSILVKDGIMQLDEMAKTKVSRQQLFAALRGKGIFNLGEIDRVYLEACGIFTICKKKRPAPGLILFPPDDPEINCFSQEISEGQKVCLHCGKALPGEDAEGQCPVCDSSNWEVASVSVPTESNQIASQS
ncbi:DUF421 domain-containing protein [Dyadobacter chenwenxiniae]|uniref:DUF421 domain-containing protein n=1 Tax=Dyadobacter chenwenxiniae TaxID=2906456 RepID=A0A9X1PMQ1_9BACT|nr:YetF domain-containing protein [Dyadobacter chenwenxiniae]MCF0063275.1 DUF421 domain-containing protein [Dyadobacter chenwenxiniae]UON85345.1 DUF421 domain-containing protein [Dyadobacter chenwenxiniae]